MGHALYLSHSTQNLAEYRIFGSDTLFGITFLADWSKIGEHRQMQTDKNTEWENIAQID